MGGHTLKFTPFLLGIFFFFLIFLLPIFVRAEDDVCENVNCMKGTCITSNSSVLGFDCVCYSGWKKLQIGSFNLPTCMLPNCTINSQCGNNAPSPTPLPPSDPPPFNLSDPCNLIWCGDGRCVANGTGHNCKCNEGSSNLFNLTDSPCFQQCSFGADCSALGLGPLVMPPPPPPFGTPPPPSGIALPLPPPNGTLAPPPQPPSRSPPNGSTNTSKSLRTWETFNIMTLLSAIILALISPLNI